MRRPHEGRPIGKAILGDALRAKLNGLNEVVEVCEPTGKTVGVFLPEELYREFVAAWAKAEFSTPEAIREREEALADYRAGRAMTTAEAIAHHCRPGPRSHELPGPPRADPGVPRRPGGRPGRCGDRIQGPG